MNNYTLYVLNINIIIKLKRLHVCNFEHANLRNYLTVYELKNLFFVRYPIYSKEGYSLGLTLFM